MTIFVSDLWFIYAVDFLREVVIETDVDTRVFSIRLTLSGKEV